MEPPGFSKEPLIVLHPGSGSTHKCAHPALWASIVHDLMTRLNRKVCLIGGPADTDSHRNVQQQLPHHKPKILTDRDLLSVGFHLQYAKLFIGHDSGLSHLATSMGVPSVLLFGPTDPDKWAPRGRHVAIMRKSCHCVGKEFINQCQEKPCLSIPTIEIMAKVEEHFRDTQATMSLAHLGFGDETPYVPCLV
jgi:ADP-heptose:LPS heptosyltransferase